MNHNIHRHRGFTLIEMIVATFIFSVVMTIAVGATLSIVAANQQAQAVKSVISNFSFALESMIRNLRVGTDYRCGGGDADNNCSWQGSHGGSSLTFTDYNGNTSGYRLNGTSIQRYSQSEWIDITSPDVKLDKLVFYVDGNGQNKKQPAILIVIAGHVSFNNKVTNFTIETMAVERKVDPNETSGT